MCILISELKHEFSFYLEVLSCIRENEHIRNLQGSKTKTVAGWTNGFKDGTWNHKQSNMSNTRCSDARWFAFCWGPCTGFIKTKLDKCGKASITIGNCYKSPDYLQLESYSEAKLNGKQILKVIPHETNTIEFDFRDGDIFELADIGYGVVELYDFKIISCSPC